MKVAIIGGGIAGLTAALALQKANIPFVVYESTKEIKPLGAGIAIANNAMQVYKHLGVAEALSNKGTRISTILLTDDQLNVLTETDLTVFENQYQLANIALHRSELHQVLLANLKEEHVVLNKRLDRIEPIANEHYQLHFTDGTSATHQYVIGADGIRSKVRSTLFGDIPLRDAKQVCWRGVLDFELPTDYQNTALEGWGRGKRFGFVKLGTKQVYWYFLVDEDIYKDNSSLPDLIKDCHPMVQDMILKTQESVIHIDNIYDLKPFSTWYKNGVCLIGDAAHATTPNLGQGACQAIEDVYVISRLLEQYPLVQALTMYPAIRKSKAHKIVYDSWQLGQIAQIRNPLLVKFRNASFGLLPSFLKNKQIRDMFILQKV